MPYVIEYTDLFNKTYFSPSQYPTRKEAIEHARFARVAYIDGKKPKVEPSRRTSIKGVRVRSTEDVLGIQY